MDNDSVIRKKASIFERNILRRIFGPIYENDSEWTIRYNEELNELLGGPDIVRYSRIKRLQWDGHIVQIIQYVFIVFTTLYINIIISTFVRTIY